MLRRVHDLVLQRIAARGLESCAPIADPLPVIQAQPDPTDLLAEVLARKPGGFLELRYHKKRTRSVAVEKGRLDTAQITEHTGVGVRVLEEGTFGFASTDRTEASAISDAIDAARSAARAQARGSSASIASAACAYTEIFEEKGIVTSDGAKAWTRLVRPEFRVSAVAQKDGQIQRGVETVGATGGWDCLFRRATPEQMADKAASRAVDLLSAGYPDGGRVRVLLSPALVGILTHEAVGHTVEADFVQAGSVAAGKLGQRVASERVTLADSGVSELVSGAG